MHFVHFGPVAFAEPVAGPAVVAPAVVVAADATELSLLQHAAGLAGRQLVPVAVELPLVLVVDAVLLPVADAQVPLVAVAADGVPPAGELAPPAVA